MTEKENRDTEVLEIMAENIADVAKSLQAIRMWIVVWTGIAIIGFIMFILLAMTRV